MAGTCLRIKGQHLPRSGPKQPSFDSVRRPVSGQHLPKGFLRMRGIFDLTPRSTVFLVGFKPTTVRT